MWAEKLEIPVKSVYLRPMRNKWASFSTSGQIQFNDELMTMPKKLGEYVIVHELLHSRVPNHGKLWKSYMNAYMPGWEGLEMRLRNMNGRSNGEEKDIIVFE